MNVAASDDYTASIWDALTVNQVRKLVGHTGRVTETVFSPNDAPRGNVSHDGTRHLWETELCGDPRILHSTHGIDEFARPFPQAVGRCVHRVPVSGKLVNPVSWPERLQAVSPYRPR